MTTGVNTAALRTHYSVIDLTLPRPYPVVGIWVVPGDELIPIPENSTLGTHAFRREGAETREPGGSTVPLPLISLTPSRSPRHDHRTCFNPLSPRRRATRIKSG